MEPMNFKQKIGELNLPQGSYVVVGSGILAALGIRESNDIDLVITDKDYANIEESGGWEHGEWSDQIVLKKGIFDIGTRWYGKTAEQLLIAATVVDGVPYLSLDDVYEWKKSLGREKDLSDLVLIDEYRKTLNKEQ